MQVQDVWKLPFSFDVDRMKSELLSFKDEDWINHFNTAIYKGQWSAVPLKGPAGASHPILSLHSDPGCTEWAETEYLHTRPYLQSVLHTFECPTTSVRLLKLGPNSSIDEHTDHNLGWDDGEIRIHVPIQTNPAVEFIHQSQRVVMGEGECWYLNFNLPHRVHNRGEFDRIHLLIDCKVNDWLTDLAQQHSSASR